VPHARRIRISLRSLGRGAGTIFRLLIRDGTQPGIEYSLGWLWQIGRLEVGEPQQGRERSATVSLSFRCRVSPQASPLWLIRE